ncbi:MAG: anaerobic glycerol-3-phosphate dehydrogenase subunit GlpB [Candidatus Helarchaeota archaeon]
MKADVVVIGGGIAGFSAAFKSKNDNNSVILVKKSTGATFFSSGAIDVASYYPRARNTYYDSPKDCIEDILRLNPNHPYSKIGSLNEIGRFYNEWKDLFVQDFQLKGSLDHNVHLINFSGTVKPSNLATEQIYDGNIYDLNEKSLALIGFEGYPDFNPKYCARSLENTLSYLKDINVKKISHFSIVLDKLSEIGNLHSIVIAQNLEKEEILQKVVETLKSNSELMSHDVLAFPPLLGLLKFKNVREKMKNALNKEVIEILSYPPSVPGYRLQFYLEQKAQERGINVLQDLEIMSFKHYNDKITSIKGKYGKFKQLELEANEFILATGKFIGGGIKEEKNFIRESIFNLPIFDELGRFASFEPLQKMFNEKVLPKEGQPFLSVGVKVNQDFQPVDARNEIIFKNLRAAGQVLSGYNYVSEKNGLGVAFLTGMAAGGKCNE